jgi:arylsulfatase A-like enzyme
MFADATPPSMSDPSYNEADVGDKPGYVRHKDPVLDAHMRNYFVSRIRSLQAVDEAVERAVAALRQAGELDNTMIVFTSDNGYLLGEHRLATKNVGYEQALQVPLLVRGPGIPAGVERDTAAGTLDLAPTFLDAAHADADITVDGLSLLPAARDDAGVDRDTMLLQSGPVADADLPYGWFYRGLRTARYTYLYYPATAEAELYDRELDPHELTSVSGSPRYRAVEAELAARVDALGSCNGADCRQTFGPVPGPAE